jgi:GAF domain-containing protein/HAMP domain-containing protein
MSNSSTSPSKHKPGPRRRLTTTLFLAFLAIALVPAVAITTISAVSQIRAAQAGAVAHLEDVAVVHQERTLAWVEANQASLLLSAQDPTIYRDVVFMLTHPADAEGYQEAAAAFLERAPLSRPGVPTSGAFECIMLADTDGLVRASSDPGLVGFRLSGADYFEQALYVLEDVYVSSPTLDPYGALSVYYAKPIADSDGKLLGLLIGQAVVSPLVEIMSDPTGLGRTGETFLIAPDKSFVARSRSRETLLTADSTAIRAVVAGQSGSGVWMDYRGQTVVGAYRWIPQLGVGLIAKQDRAEALSAAYAQVSTSVLIGVLALMGVAVASALLARRIIAPIAELTRTTQRIAAGEFDLRVQVQRDDELGQLADTFNETTERIRMLIDSLEDRVRERTRDLQITAEIGHSISAIRDIDQVLNRTIELICERLGYYHAQVFLLDDVKQHAVLRASTGEAGRELLRRGHKLEIGSQSVIGQVMARGEPVAARDTDTSPIYRRNELLPDTRAELAVPIRLAGEVIGALDVQSVESEAFDPQTISVLQTIANQLAVAINNARLFEETQSLLTTSVQTTRLLTREGWQEFVKEQQEALGFTYNLSDVLPLADEWPATYDEDGGGIDTPITLRGQIIGQLMAQPPEGRQWTDEDRALIEAIAERLALALENARLFGQTQATLQATTRLYEASRAISEASSVEELLDTVLKAVAGDEVDRVVIALLDDPDSPPQERWAEMSAIWKGLEDDPLQPGNRLSASNIPLLADVERSGQPIVINDLRDTAELDPQSRNVLLAFGIQAIAIIPIEAGGRTLGWLMIQTLRQPRDFGQSEVRFYRSIADQAGAVLESTVLLDLAQARARQLQAANDVSRAAASILDPDILLPQVVERISQAFGYYHTQVFVIDEMGENAVLRASTGEVGRKLLARRHSLSVGSQSVIGQVTAHGEPAIARDTDTDSVHRRNELLPDTRSELAIPLKIGTRVVGALDVQSEHPNAFDQEAVVILQTLADQIAVSLENAQLFHEIEQRVAELATINLASQALARARTLDELCYYLAEQLAQTFGAQHAYLALWDRADDLVRFPIFIQDGQSVGPPPPLSPGGSLIWRVLRTGQPLMLNQAVAEAAKTIGEQLVGSPAKSWLGVPLMLGDEALGVISLQDTESENAFDLSHQRLLIRCRRYPQRSIF